MLADRLYDESGLVKYLVRAGDETMPQVVVIEADERSVRTEDGGELYRGTRVMVGKIIRQRVDTGVWPERTGLES